MIKSLGLGLAAIALVASYAWMSSGARASTASCKMYQYQKLNSDGTTSNAFRCAITQCDDTAGSCSMTIDSLNGKTVCACYNGSTGTTTYLYWCDSRPPVGVNQVTTHSTPDCSGACLYESQDCWPTDWVAVTAQEAQQRGLEEGAWSKRTCECQ